MGSKPSLMVHRLEPIWPGPAHLIVSFNCNPSPNYAILLSPGHSPRHLSSPSPSSPEAPSSSFTGNFLSKSNDCSSITPNNPRKRATVLDENTYVAAIEKIIERDFFRDISKLSDRIDWMEDVKSGNLMQALVSQSV